MSWLKRLFSSGPTGKAPEPEGEQIDPVGKSTSPAGKPTDPAELARALVGTGFERHQGGDLSGARQCYEQALTIDQSNDDARYLLGTTMASEGDHASAIAAFSTVIANNPSIASFHHSLASSLRMTGRTLAACDAYAAAVVQAPGDPDYRNDYASCLTTLGRHEEAVVEFERTLALNPSEPSVLYNLANVLRELGQLDEAVIRYQQAVALNPQDAAVLNNLGLVYKTQGDHAKAEHQFRAAQAANAEFLDASNNLGVVLHLRKRVDEAIDVFRALIARAPDYAKAYANLGLALQDQGRYLEAATTYEQYLAQESSVGIQVRKATLLPVVPQSVAEIETSRARFVTEVSALFDHELRLDDPVVEVGTGAFYLAYHGLNNRELHALVGALYRQLCPSLKFTAAHCQPSPLLPDESASERGNLAAGQRRQRLRVGFISKFMYDHSIGRTTSGLVANLCRDQFEVIAIFIAPFVNDAMSGFITESADEAVILPDDLARARERIAALQLDVLFFQDIGMEPTAYFLAHARLAPVQCLSFGHPDTTGIANMDYFVTSELFETADCEDHYSEQVFKLRGIASLAYYYRPALRDPPKRRVDFGLREDQHCYVCAQTLFKFHPDFDTTLRNILCADPDGVLVLVEASTAHLTALLQRRFETSLADVINRVVWVPGLSRADFLNLLAVCDVALDTLHFNGMNTSLEAFAVGTPVVTQPTALQRGRHTFGMYTRMGIDACIARDAAHYVSIAVALGTDPAERERISAQILARNDCLYEDVQVVREFERFFLETAST